MPQLQVRLPRPEGDILRVRVMDGLKVLVSAQDHNDFVQLQEHRRAHLVFLFPDFRVRQVLPARCGYLYGVGARVLGFVYNSGVRELPVQDLPEGVVVYVFPEQATI